MLQVAQVPFVPDTFSSLFPLFPAQLYRLQSFLFLRANAGLRLGVPGKKFGSRCSLQVPGLSHAVQAHAKKLPWIRGIDSAKGDSVSSTFVMVLVLRVCNFVGRIWGCGSIANTAQILGKGFIG